ncbi:hypothetical protein M0P98_08745 [bacterium]|nr:hypothetical protein [bacterium]
MLTEKEIKEHAKLCGADIVGITSTERLKDLPKEMNPLYIFPEAKSVIVLGYRIFRGVFRGIEEGTWFASYNLMGYNGIRWVFQPVTMWNFTKILEDQGYEAIPVVDNFPWSNIDNLQPDMIGQDFINVNKTAYGNMDKYAGKWSRPVSPSKPAPDIFIPFKLLAYAAGLGNIGYSGMFLTPEFGPRQMFSCVITDMPLKEDPLYEEPLCDNCMLCVKECPGKAISEKEKVAAIVAGKKLEWAKVDFKKCSIAFHGGTKEFNPFMVTKEDEEGFNKKPYTESMKYKLEPTNFDGRGIEGMRGCQMACFMHLESQGKLTNKFKKPFRRKPAWVLKEERQSSTDKYIENRMKVDE